MKNIKKIIKVSLLTVGFLLSVKSSYSQLISDHFFGENTWMPDTIGDYKACKEPPCILYGKLHKQWSNIKSSGASIVRFGGIAADKNMPTNYQYIKMIDSIRAKGMEPIIQVPFCNNRYTAQQAADIVKYINIIKGKKIKYWIIANEPDLSYSFTTSSQIAQYFKPFASAMKAVDPSILIVGPECAWFNQTILTGLTTPNGPDDITGKDASGNYYLDIISFHTYPFDGTQTRADVVSKLTAPNSLNENLAYLNTRVANCNSAHNRTGVALLKTAITEANINWQNNTSDNLNGLGANSFIGGQFMAEMMGIGMKNNLDFINIWSVIEGNSTASNIGFIDATTNNKKPLYYHFKLLANNFKGNYLNGITNQVNVKSFGSQNAQQTSVLILNEDLTNNYNFTVRLDNSAISGNGGLNININAGLNKEYSGVISNQSTTILKFDAAGNLIEKTEYKLSGNADVNLAPTVTTLPSALSAIIIPAASTTICSGSSVTLNANVGTGYSYQWKKDNTSLAGATNSSYIANAAGNYSVSITSAEITTTSAATTITLLPAPIASITPQGATSFIAGDSVVLNATTGTDYIYQWKKDNIGINGATNTSYVANQSGAYQIKTTLGICNNWSAPLSITVFPKATITAAGATNFCSGGNVKLNANVVKGYAYQWKKDNVAIAGSTDSSYIAIESGGYSVVATIAGLTTTSGIQVIKVTPLPSAIITAASATSFVEGNSVVLNATTGTGYTYQWKKDNELITGATNGSYTTSIAGSYQVEITSEICKSLSASVTVAVLPIAVITAAGSTSFCAGGNVRLNAKVMTGYTFQWKKDNIEIAGATDSLYIAAASGSYSVVVTKGGNTNTSTAIAVTAISVPVATITPLGATTICSGTVGLQANTGSGLIYQWKKDNNAIDGATNSSYSATVTGSYQIRVTQGSCTSWSAPLSVSIQGDKNATITPDGPITFCSGGKVVLYANTCSDYLYQWKKNGANIKGATASSYIATTSGSYQVKITSSAFTEWSAPLSVTVNNCKPSGSIASKELTLDSTTVTSLSNEENVNSIFEINVFPNPSNGKFTIQLSNKNSEQNNIEIQLINSNGQEVYHENGNFLNGKEEIILGDNITSGLYIMRVMVGNNIIIKRIIINNL